MLYGVYPRPILKPSTTWASCNPAVAASSGVGVGVGVGAGAAVSSGAAAASSSSSTSYASQGPFHHHHPHHGHPITYDAYPWTSIGPSSHSSSSAPTLPGSDDSPSRRRHPMHHHSQDGGGHAHRGHHVRFPQSPSTLTRTAATHSSAVYDRSPIIVDRNNQCKLPERGCPGRTYMLDEYDRKSYAIKREQEAAASASASASTAQHPNGSTCISTADGTDLAVDPRHRRSPTPEEEESIAYHKALPSSKIYMEPASRRPSSTGGCVTKRPCMRNTRFGGEELEGGDGCLGGF